MHCRLSVLALLNILWAAFGRQANDSHARDSHGSRLQDHSLSSGDTLALHVEEGSSSVDGNIASIGKLQPWRTLATLVLSSNPSYGFHVSGIRRPAAQVTTRSPCPLMGSVVTGSAQSLAWAAKAAASAGEHLHLGQKIAQFFRGFGLADEAVITIISAMPVVELRGAIPVGIWMGLPLAKVLALCVLGNMLPIAPLLYALRFAPVQRVMKPILDRAQSKAEAAFGDLRSRGMLLAAFVGVPLPGTGAWTGAMGAFLLGMPFAQAWTAIFAGVVSSGCIMTAITRGGVFGAGVGAVLLGSMLSQVRGGNKAEESPDAPPATDEDSAQP